MKFLSRIAKWLNGEDLPLPYRGRILDRQTWQDHFGQDFGLADNVLRLFCHAYGFDLEDRYKLHPQDHVRAIHTALYPSKMAGDGSEDARFVKLLEVEFDVRLDDARLEKTETFEQIVAEVKRTRSL